MPDHQTFVSRITGALGATSPTPRLTIASLGYHEVTDDPSRSGFQRPAARPYKHTCAAFQEHIEAIGKESLVPTLVTEVDYRKGDGTSHSRSTTAARAHGISATPWGNQDGAPTF